MANAGHDANSVPTLTTVLNTNGSTIVVVKADPTTHALNTADGTGSANNGPTNAKHDQNHVPTLVALSSADGITPVVVYGDSSGHLLINAI